MLRVWLLGTVAVERDDELMSVTPPEGRLLAYLALHPGPCDRETVATALWPNSDPTGARANLRTGVWTLRKAIGDYLVSSRTAVGLTAGVWVDVHDGDLADISRGDLLPGLPGDWVQEARRIHHAHVLETLDEAAEAAELDGDLVTAVRWSRRRCELEPLDEPAHADLLRRLTAAGDRAGAIVAARAIVTRLREELGVNPGPHLRAAWAQVRGPVDLSAEVSAATRPMFGRADDLRRLMAAWALARGGHGQVAVITGEAGIGKSRLAAELAHRADNSGARIAVGFGVDVGGEAPLAMWQELVPKLARTVPAPSPTAAWPAELGRLAPEVPARLGHSEPPAWVASPELERLRLFHSVLRLVEWAASDRPVLLVTEDVHRADRASMQLAAHIAHRLRQLPVLLVLTRRDRPERPDTDALIADLTGRGVDVTEIDIGSLSPAELAAVVRSVAELPDADVDRVVRAADGSPLLAVETARTIAAGITEPPPSLRALVRAATGALTRPGRDLAEALAAAGRALSMTEIAALKLPVDAEEAVLDTGLLRRSPAGLGFRHALLAEAVRANLDPSSRRYEQLALAIETAAPEPDRVAAEVARHLQRAGRSDLAGPRWQRAARRARSMGALPEAASFWQEAIRCGPAAELHLELGEVYGWLGQPEDFEREWKTALGLLPADRQAVAWLRRGKVLRTVVCHPTGSLAAYQQAMALMPADGAAELATEALIGTAWGEASAGDPNRAAAILADLPQPRDDAAVAELENVRLMTLIRQGRFRECSPVAERGGAAAIRARRPDLAYAIWVHTASALACAGDLDAALRAADQAVAATLGGGIIEVHCLAARALVLSRLGRHEEALTAARIQLEHAERVDRPDFFALAQHDAGVVAAAAGRHDEAARLLGAALSGGALISRPAARLIRAEALARAGQPDEAAGELRAATLEPIRQSDHAWALVPRVSHVQGVIALARGDDDQARRRLREAADGWRRLHADAGDEYMSNFVDLGRPPVVGLVEPARELARLETELAALEAPLEVP
ncbi:MAG: AAA family ATPase [Intrasporangium sp.]|uniref:AAA family ATPase n=1 Tax=Intrasporangium sp. TaxID=1925024 RepID=UPI003F82356E